MMPSTHRSHHVPVLWLVPMGVVLLVPLPVDGVGQDAADDGHPGQHCIQATSKHVDPRHVVGHLNARVGT